jgi:hypothetical protein
MFFALADICDRKMPAETPFGFAQGKPALLESSCGRSWSNGYR